MNTVNTVNIQTNTQTKTNKEPRKRFPVTIHISRHFVGHQTITEALVPVIIESLQKKQNKIRTFDNDMDMT